MSNVASEIQYTGVVTEAIRNQTDGTWGPNAKSDSGYFVGGVVPSLVLDDESGAALQHQTLRAMVAGALSRDNNVGVWTDTETGKIYVDESSWFEDESEALRVGAERKEIAIWDVANSREIRIQY